ncbi:hypothetical protein QTG54_015895 [Skeletonema marinoi]|uniref:Uncharacterized protein n=1 Tax=Skeletonema marinoi TaxID=267567 RepID=A0A6U3U7M1_9STRA|nr:hypothetical protein QTG54_015895 [Skeletonema marinoi]|mmetsp:Transcript_18611/g.31420  ORF Transcript_18611/g.31420 Transcript_18611/m.31420 type:complete len:110 (+) Transcript_18611:203-532(+)
MRNPVNRLATAAPRAFDSILKPTSTTTTSSTTDSTNTENEKRSRGASFHMMDLSVLLTTDNTNDGSSITAPPGSVGDETGSVLTFDAIQNSTSLDYCGWGWNDKGEVGL